MALWPSLCLFKVVFLKILFTPSVFVWSCLLDTYTLFWAVDDFEFLGLMQVFYGTCGTFLVCDEAERLWHLCVHSGTVGCIYWELLISYGYVSG